jgi:hypothetical protein
MTLRCPVLLSLLLLLPLLLLLLLLLLCCCCCGLRSVRNAYRSVRCRAIHAFL